MSQRLHRLRHPSQEYAVNLDQALAELEKAEAELPREIEESPLSYEDHRVMLRSWLVRLKDSLSESERAIVDARFYAMMHRVGLMQRHTGDDGGGGGGGLPQEASDLDDAA